MSRHTMSALSHPASRIHLSRLTPSRREPDEREVAFKKNTRKRASINRRPSSLERRSISTLIPQKNNKSNTTSDITSTKHRTSHPKHPTFRNPLCICISEHSTNSSSSSSRPPNHSTVPVVFHIPIITCLRGGREEGKNGVMGWKGWLKGEKG